MDIGFILRKICDVEEIAPNNWEAVLAPNVWIFFDINSSGPKYSVGPSWRKTTDSPFTDLERLDTESLDEAVERFKTYFGFKDGNIDPKYLPIFNKWQHQKFRHPANPGLISFPTVNYSMRMPGFRHLAVTRSFSRPSRSGSTGVSYTGPEANELIQIASGQIVQKIHCPNKDFSSLKDPQKLLRAILDRSDETEEIMLITQYKDKLRELPWQDDLEVIYSL
ncbi:hypothetical protein KY329_05465 [Candidatus Woesearchaeota archaeon]|nr:hypothetical protein [Candidatus Woesearchaeota archaeon]